MLSCCLNGNPKATTKAVPSLSLRAVVQMVRSEERRVGKECRSRCDWSSDVCSSDLFLAIVLDALLLPEREPEGDDEGRAFLVAASSGTDGEIGRASCRERV